MALETIYMAGDDALGNQFQVVIPAFPGCVDPVGINLRVTDFTCPELTVGTYPVDYKGGSFEKPSGKNDSAKDISFTFRIDKFWNSYKSFVNLKQLMSNDLTYQIGYDVLPGGVAPYRFPVTVLTLDGLDIPTSSGWQYNFCFLKSISAPSFSMSSGDALTCDISMGFVSQKVIG